MFAFIASLLLAAPPQTTLPCQGPQCTLPKQTSEPPVIRLRCTDGSWVERTAKGWRLVGTPKTSESTPNVSSGCRIINGQMVCPQKR